MTDLPAESMAQRLLDAERTARPLVSLSDRAEPLSVAEGYRVQAHRNALAQAAGATPVGFKIGLTSGAAQSLFKASEPMRGVLYAHTRLATPGQIDLEQMCSPRLEGEIILKVGSCVSPDADDAALLESIASVHAAVEVADSRIANWNIGIGEAIADNACCGRFAMVEPGLSPHAVDLATVAMTITNDAGAVVSSGSGAACMGSPLNAYRWLLADLAKPGLRLRPGQIVLTGALGPIEALAEPGRSYVIATTGLSELSVTTA